MDKKSIVSPFFDSRCISGTQVHDVDYEHAEC